MVCALQIRRIVRPGSAGRLKSGTAQGSVLSPLLGNAYLHYVLDLWFEQAVKPRLRGRATLIRYCDDFIIGFEQEEDARCVMDLLGKRLGCFGLALHPDKTRLLPFRRQSGRGREIPMTV